MKILEAIAQKLRREADIGGIARHRLQRGLALTLRQDNGDYILSLTREGAPPGEKEEQICRRAFGVSEMAERHTDQLGGWHIVRLRWQPAPACLFEMAPDTGGYYREGL